jgi:hypothetical protein
LRLGNKRQGEPVNMGKRLEPAGMDARY